MSTAEDTAMFAETTQSQRVDFCPAMPTDDRWLEALDGFECFFLGFNAERKVLK